MSWTGVPTAEEFAKDWAPVLSENESLHCLAWAAIARSSKAAEPPSKFRFFSLKGEHSPEAYAVLFAQKKELVLSDMTAAQAVELLPLIEQVPLDVEELEGPVEAVTALAEAWSRSSSRSHSTVMHQALHEVHDIEHPDTEGGHLRPATREQQETVHRYLRGFVTDCFPKDNWSGEKIATRAERLLKERKGYLWLDASGEPVSMAAIVRESPNTASISLVYTPPKHRRRGHAARVVAALSQAQLDAGKSACNLHTDLANPTSNSVYYRIGYRVIQKLVRVRLLRSEASRQS